MRPTSDGGRKKRREAKVQRHPMDYEALEPGDVFYVDEVEEMIGVSRKKDPMKYQLGVLQLICQIRRELENLGKPRYTVCSRKGAICILEEKGDEAGAHNRGGIKKALTRVVRHHNQNLAIDVRKLTDNEKKVHERSLVTTGAILAACSVIRRSPKLAAVIRDTPALRDLSRKHEEEED